MRCLLFTAAAALLLGCNTSLGQVSTVGTTALGLPTTPGAIFTSPLNGPSPFSAATLPGTPDTTLAPVPLASDPTTPGTAVTCATPTGQIAPVTPLGAIPILGSTTGTISRVSSLSSSSNTVCSFIPGGPPTNGAALSLSTPEILNGTPPGAILPVITELGDTSIDPNLTVVPAPNSAACSEGVTMNLANPVMITPANATGATATPGVSPPPPPGC